LQLSLLHKILEALLKTAKSRTKNAWKLHAARRTVFENHCSTSNINPARYNATTLAMMKSRKQSLADTLLQSGIVTRNYLSNEIKWLKLQTPVLNFKPNSGS